MINILVWKSKVTKDTPSIPDPAKCSQWRLLIADKGGPLLITVIKRNFLPQQQVKYVTELYCYFNEIFSVTADSFVAPAALTGDT
jgi:hypothetical protein